MVEVVADTESGKLIAVGFRPGTLGKAGQLERHRPRDAPQP